MSEQWPQGEETEDLDQIRGVSIPYTDSFGNSSQINLKPLDTGTYTNWVMVRIPLWKEIINKIFSSKQNPTPIFPDITYYFNPTWEPLQVPFPTASEVKIEDKQD